MRIEALRLGLEEIVQVRREVRIGPVELKASQEVRLQRIAPGAVVRSSVLFLPLRQADVVPAVADFLRTMWPPEGD